MARVKADLSPYVRSSMPLVSSAGAGTAALAEAFESIGEMFDSYGKNRDAKLLASYKDEKDSSNINAEEFYSPLNAFKAKEVANRNQSLDRQLEQQARSDSEYYQNQFTKEAANDALTMNKDAWNKKYENTGGLNQSVISDVWRGKKLENREDNIYNQQQEQYANNKNRNKIIQQREDEEYRYNLGNRKKSDAGKTLLNDVMSGTINTVDGLKHYADSVDVNSFNAAKKIIEDNNFNNTIGDISSKYKSWDEFKQSSDWSNSSYKVKDALSKTKVWGEKPKQNLTFDQNIKKEQINLRKKDLANIMAEYQEKTKKPMSLTEQTAFIYEGKIPKVLEKKDALTPKEAKEFDGLLKYLDTLNQLEEAYKSSYVGGLDSSLNTITPNFLHSDGHRRFNALMNDLTLDKTSALSGTLSDKDMKLLQDSGLSDALGEEDYKRVLGETKDKVIKLIKERKTVLGDNYSLPEHYDYIDSLNADNKSKVKTKTISKRNNTDTNTSTKTLTPEELEKAGIKFN